MDAEGLRAAIVQRLEAPPVRRGLRKRRPPVSLAVFTPVLAGDGERLLEAVTAGSKATDVTAGIGEGVVAVLLDGADEAGAATYLQRLRAALPVRALSGTATAADGDTPEALLERAWPAG